MNCQFGGLPQYTSEKNLKPFFKSVKVAKLTTDKINEYRKSRVAEIVAKKNPEDSRVPEAG